MTTATDGAGLLAAVRADPADDVPRLVYSDWLDEQGQADFAHFIRHQIAVDTAPLVYEIRGHAPRGERIKSGGHAFDESWLTRFLVNHCHLFPSLSGEYVFRRG